jgi:hypothetical protein
MSIDRKFKALVQGLDQEALKEASRLVASEIAVREAKTAFRIDDIHPGMTSAEKEQAAMQIAQVLAHIDAEQMEQE